MKSTRTLAAALASAGILLLAWVLYDPSTIVAALRPIGQFNEAIVALASLGVVCALFAAAACLVSASRRLNTGRATP